MAAVPPKYFSMYISRKIKIGSFPDLPKASQKTYSSMIVSPMTKTFRFEKEFIMLKILLSVLNSFLFLILFKNDFCSFDKFRLV